MNGYVVAVLALASAYVTCASTVGAGAFLLLLPALAMLFAGGYLAGKAPPESKA